MEGIHNALQGLQTADRPEVRDLRNYDIYSFSYPFGPPLVPDALDLLRRFVENTGAKYDTIVLIGHSQGGILAKLYVLDMLENGRGLQLKVDLIITLDTPHRGPRWWFYPVIFPVQLWNSIFGPRRIPLGRQIGDLAVSGRNLRKLRDDWGKKYISEDSCAPQACRRPVRSYWFPGTRQWVVSEESARGFGPDRRGYQNRPWVRLGLAGENQTSPRLFEAGHQANQLTRYRHEVARLLREHDEDQVRAIRAEVVAIRATQAAWNLFCGRHAAELTGLLHATASQGTAWTATCVLRGFLLLYPSRPLRRLQPGPAIHKFAELNLRECER